MRNMYYLCTVFLMERAAKDTKFGVDKQILTVKRA